ncbi:MAG: MBL fold metallo-hydrolase [Ignavibacteria bacterium]|nr:MBL fold metallo-hydrolase [Ignavibacteria bacterium]
MKTIKFTVNPFSMNCYIYYDEISKDAVIIDPGAFTEDEKNEIIKFVDDHELNINKIINTHGHIDHVLGNSFAKEVYDKPICMNEDDVFLLEEAEIRQGSSDLKFLLSPVLMNTLAKVTLLPLEVLN